MARVDQCVASRGTDPRVHMTIQRIWKLVSESAEANALRSYWIWKAHCTVALTVIFCG